VCVCVARVEEWVGVCRCCVYVRYCISYCIFLCLCEVVLVGIVCLDPACSFLSIYL